MRPHVFISLATSNLGGPGKGLLQFLRSGGFDLCDPVVVDFVTESGCESEFARVMRLSGANVAELRQNKKFDMNLVDQAENIVKREGCQILQSHGYKSHVLCALLRRRVRLPWVAFVHGWTSENMKMHCYRIVEMGLVTLATRVVAVSEALGKRLPRIAQRKMTVIPNAVDPAELNDSSGRDVRQELGIPGEALVVGVVGRLSPEKGQIFFLKALAQTRKQVPNAVGILLGDGQDRAMLEAEAARCGLAGAVYFTGHVSGLGDYYRAMDIVAMPSLSEGMPNVALEAMIFAKPVVASRVGGVPEVVVEGETGFMVTAGNAESLAAALIRMLASPNRMQAMGEAGRRRALDNFSPTVRVGRLLALYKELLVAQTLEGNKNA
jgi:glycosyltransferase involved in cell wall biosynthesis